MCDIIIIDRSESFVIFISIHELYDIIRPHIKTVSKVGYEGGFDSIGQRSEKGIYRSDDGSVFDGEWLDDLKHGLGVMLHADGTIYEGENRTDESSGRSACIFSQNNPSLD